MAVWTIPDAGNEKLQSNFEPQTTNLDFRQVCGGRAAINNNFSPFFEIDFFPPFISHGHKYILLIGHSFTSSHVRPNKLVVTSFNYGQQLGKDN